MLSVPTLWTAFIINFLALGLIWAYVARSYPTFQAARFWTASAFAAAAGATLASVRIAVDSAGAAAGWRHRYGFRRLPGRDGRQAVLRSAGGWRQTALIIGVTFAGLAFFIAGHDSVQMRILVYSLGQAMPMVLTLKLLLSKQNGHVNPGARLAGVVATVMLAMFGLRAVGSLLHLGGDFSFSQSNPMQSVLVLVLMFLSMAWNFGFLLMAMDRLRNEVADLALLDDLTGVGNRRHLLQRLTEECARSARSGEPFSLLVIDLDGFKAINDTHGHAAGDACLQHFTLMAQTRLRPGDMLARTGGDEFCVVLPSSTLRVGAMIARRILDVCRGGRRGLRRHRYSDLAFDRGRAMDGGYRGFPRPADGRRRPRAVRRQERWQEPPCGLRSRPAAGARDRARGVAGTGPAQARVMRARRW